MATVESAVTECRQFIGGEWVDAAGGGTFEDLDPFTGEVVARVSAGGRDGGAAAGRRRRCDRALERRADPLGALDRGAARARQHRRLEAVRALALRRRAALGRDLLGGRAAGRRPERRYARTG